MLVRIENLENIKKFEFSLPKAGLNLLVGVNGIGKSALLTVLERIGDATAFVLMKTAMAFFASSFLKGTISLP